MLRMALEVSLSGVRDDASGAIWAKVPTDAQGQ